MTTPTNWPNPERPDWPPNPERDGFYALRAGSACVARYWSASRQFYTSVPGWPRGMTPLESSSLDFAGEILTPTQIAEMLAGERDRCLTKAVDEQWNFPSDPSIQTPEAAVAFRACQRIIDEIRNLGAAP